MACERTVERLAISFSFTQKTTNTKEHTRLHGRKHGSNARKLGVEVTRVGGALDARQERRLHALVVDVVPVDVAEEGLAHDLLRVRRPAAQPLVRLARQQLLQDRDAVARHRDGVQRLVGEDGVVDLVLVLAAEGRLLQEHLVDEHAEGPPVYRAAVLLVEEDLSSRWLVGGSADVAR